MFKLFGFAFRLLLLLFAFVALYYLIPFKIAQIQEKWANEASTGEASYNQVLHWNPHQGDALTNLAEIAKQQGDFDKAKSYALQALSVDPTNGRATTILIPVYEETNDTIYLQRALELAPRQWTAHSYVHTTLADHWAKQGDIEKVLQEWDLLLTRHRGLYQPIFPVLLSYANSSDGQDLLTPFATRPAKWWKDFFVYMIKQNVDLSVLQFFYQQRVSTNVPLEDNERNAYVRRLQQAKLWDLAYSSWVSGLSADEFALIGSVYDGGFESTRHDTGFDWYFRQSKQARISLGRTHGIAGKRALHIVFKNRKATRFKNVWQRLLLEPGRQYQVVMRARVDNLENPQGLTWKVVCADEKTQLLASSPPFRGTKKWHDISFEFSVPEQGCDSQVIRLEAVSKYHHEQFFKGGIWFDELNILPLTPDSKPASSKL